MTAVFLSRLLITLVKASAFLLLLNKGHNFSEISIRFATVNLIVAFSHLNFYLINNFFINKGLRKGESYLGIHIKLIVLISPIYKFVFSLTVAETLYILTSSLVNELTRQKASCGSWDEIVFSLFKTSLFSFLLILTINPLSLEVYCGIFGITNIWVLINNGIIKWLLAGHAKHEILEYLKIIVKNSYLYLYTCCLRYLEFTLKYISESSQQIILVTYTFFVSNFILLFFDSILQRNLNDYTKNPDRYILLGKKILNKLKTLWLLILVGIFCLVAIWDKVNIYDIINTFGILFTQLAIFFINFYFYLSGKKKELLIFNLFICLFCSLFNIIRNGFG